MPGTVRLIATAFCFIAGISCKTAEKKNATAKGFGWEEDLSSLPPPTAPACGDGTVKPDGGATSQVCDLKKVNKYDKKFCDKEAPGSCFTLVLRIPFTDLNSDYGLTALSLTSTNPNTNLRLTEACSTAWVQFLSQYQSNSLKPLRKEFANKIKKMRCIYNFFSSEYVAEDLPLGDNEIAISMRLSKFAIEGTNTTSSVNALTLKADSTKVAMSYRNLFAFKGKNIKDGKGEWGSIPNFTKPSYQMSKKIGQTISWTFSLPTLQESLGKIDVASITEPSVKDFVIKSKETVQQILAGNNALAGSITMLGMGYQAVKAICGEGGAGCKVTKEDSSILNDQNAGLTTFVPNSAVNEVVRLALITSIQGLLDSYFEGADPKDVRTWMGG